jgi:hypothetical protein
MKPWMTLEAASINLITNRNVEVKFAKNRKTVTREQPKNCKAMTYIAITCTLERH